MAGSTEDRDSSTAIDFSSSQGDDTLGTRLPVQQQMLKGTTHLVPDYLSNSHRFLLIDFLHKHPQHGQRKFKGTLLVLHHERLKGGEPKASLLAWFRAFHATVTERGDASRVRAIFSQS